MLERDSRTVLGLVMVTSSSVKRCFIASSVGFTVDVVFARSFVLSNFVACPLLLKNLLSAEYTYGKRGVFRKRDPYH